MYVCTLSVQIKNSHLVLRYRVKCGYFEQCTNEKICAAKPWFFRTGKCKSCSK